MTIDTLENFNPNGVGAANGNIFGLPHTYENAQIIIIPVPWEVTVSYLAGSARGAQAVLDYSPQIDFLSAFEQSELNKSDQKHKGEKSRAQNQ